MQNLMAANIHDITVFGWNNISRCDTFTSEDVGLKRSANENLQPYSMLKCSLIPHGQLVAGIRTSDKLKN